MDIPIFALDLAQDTGWAFWRPGMAKPMYGLVGLPRLKVIGDELYRGHASLRRFILEFHAKHDLTGAGVNIEAAWLRYGDQNANDVEDRRRDTERTILWLFGLATEAATTSYLCKAQPRYSTRGQVMTHWVGTANTPKEQVNGKMVSTSKKYSMLAAQAHGWKPSTHDVADALGLLCQAAALWEVKVPWDNRKCAGPQYLDLKAAGKIIGGA